MAYALQIAAKEQDLMIDRWIAKLRYNLFQNYWFYDLYLADTCLLAGQALKINSYPIVLEHLPYPKLFLVDTEPNNTNAPNMATDFGGRLELCVSDYTEE